MTSPPWKAVTPDTHWCSRPRGDVLSPRWLPCVRHRQRLAVVCLLPLPLAFFLSAQGLHSNSGPTTPSLGCDRPHAGSKGSFLVLTLERHGSSEHPASQVCMSPVPVPVQGLNHLRRLSADPWMLGSRDTPVSSPFVPVTRCPLQSRAWSTRLLMEHSSLFTCLRQRVTSCVDAFSLASSRARGDTSVQCTQNRQR